MKKNKILTLCLFTFFSFFPYQSNAQVSAGAGMGMFSVLEKDADAQLGINLSGKFVIGKKMRVGANFGYYFKSYKDYNSKYRTFTMPITGLFEYTFLTGKFIPYAGAEMGIYRMGSSGDGNTNAVGNIGLAPVVGLDFELSDKLGFNANFKYHIIFFDGGEYSSALGLNAGIFFKF